ncbi:MAG: hypothetical protein C4K47_03595 [Candidatus Thorarchaeota archaeon]|nr:MAG: hypothetical protein C4K47_03595 [Candidatus Thorarchaeota archaeon]
MVVAAIDAGTTGVRCMIVSRHGEVLGAGRKPWGYTTPASLEIAKEFSPKEFWNLTCAVIRQALKVSGIPKSEIEAVATTSQRHGVVFLDKDGQELYGGPNMDARGAMTQYIIEDALGERFHEITGCWPPLVFAPSRLAWFEEEEPEIRQTVAHMLPINDWITYRLSGSFVADPSSASGTGFFDVKSRDWSPDIADAVQADLSILPEIHEAGTIVGEVSKQAERECGLPAGLKVAQGGTDTHCALVATETDVNEITVIAGSTAPSMLVTDCAICVPDQKLWTSCHMIPGQWTVESNSMLTGALLDWAVRLLCERAENPEKCVSQTFSKLSEVVASIPPGSNETYAGLGPSIMDCRKMTEVPQARIFFPQPALPNVVSLNAASLIHAVMENITYSIRGNCDQLAEFAQVKAVKAIGGMTRGAVWTEMLANVLNTPVHTTLQSEGSLLGAAICAARGAGWYPSLQAAAHAMVQWKPVVDPDERANAYKSCYSKWTEIWYGHRDEQ